MGKRSLYDNMYVSLTFLGFLPILYWSKRYETQLTHLLTETHCVLRQFCIFVGFQVGNECHIAMIISNSSFTVNVHLMKSLGHRTA